MKFLKKLKSSNFWVSMISAVVLILQAAFNVEIKTEYLTQIIMAILGLLVMSGIVTDTASGEVVVNQKNDTENIKKDISEIFSQVMLSFQSNIESIVKQLETSKSEVQAESSNPAEEERVIVELEVNDEHVQPNTQIETIKQGENIAQKQENNDIL